MKNLRFHVIAITAISLLVTALYLIFGPGPEAPPPPAKPQKGDRQVEIISATWGENCNQDIAQALEDRALEAANPPPVAVKPKEEGLVEGAQRAEKQVVEKLPETLKKVLPNNVLPKVKELCDHQFSCELRASSDKLGVDPMTACSKNLVVSYRCFSFDKLTMQELEQGKSLVIDCRTKNTPHAPAAASAQ